jgi:hypothetical protein
MKNSLLTVGTTVDEAAFLFYSLDKACHSQLMAEAAAANGLAKKIIPDHVAKYTADAVQNPVGLVHAALYRIVLTGQLIPASITSIWNSSLSLS